MSNKLPALHLYIGDLLKDPSFSLCNWQAQNLWLRLLLHLHEMPVRGELRSLSGQPLTNVQIAKLCCMPTDICDELLQELESNEVFSRVDGAVVNRRMVKERQGSEQREIISQIRSENGTKGARARWQNDGKTMRPRWQTEMANACDPDGKRKWQNDATDDFAIMAKESLESSSSMANACDNMAKVPPYSSSSSSSSSSSIKNKKDKNDVEFETFWNAYPRKTGKKKARAAWGKAKDRPAMTVILAKIVELSKTDQWVKDDGKFIPHPSTWLNDGRWDDQPVKPQPDATRSLGLDSTGRFSIMSDGTRKRILVS